MATVTNLNLSGLTEHIDANREQLFVEAAVAAKTLDYTDLMLNVKHKSALNYLNSEVVFQEASCTWSPNGSDTFAQRFIEVVPVEIEKSWCMFDFKNYWMNYELRFAAGRETLPKEEALVKSNLEAIKAGLDNLVWNGSRDLGLDGFLAQIADEGVEVSVASGSTTTEKIDAAVAACTAKMLAKGVDIFVSMTDFRNYVMESNGTCCAGRPILDAAAEEITYVGDSRIRIIPVMGLEDSGAVVAASRGNLVYATDIEDSEAIYELWFDRKDQNWNFRVLFNAGTAIKFPDEAILVTEGEGE